MVQAASTAGGGNGFTTILFLLLLFGVVYFLMIRPQQKRRREAASMQSSLGPGDQIVTIGGLHGTVVSIDDDVVVLEIAPGVVVTFARQAIARTLAKSDVPAEPVEEPAGPVADDAVGEPAATIEEPAEEPVDNPAADTRKKD